MIEPNLDNIEFWRERQLALEDVNVVSLLISIVINVVVQTLFVWLAGRIMVGAEKAKFTDALWIVVINALISGVLGALNWGWIGAIITFVLYLGLIKHFFDCGWIKALIIAIVTVILQIIIGIILVLLGVAGAFALGALGF